jgi:phospholipase/carboxylesterase
MVMLFGARDAAEVDIVVGVVTTSHAWASGQGEAEGMS